MGPSVLLHGDLHHGNILAGTRQEWLAIDPQGVVGETAYEVGAFLRNPIEVLTDRPDLIPLMSRRVSLVAETMQLDRARVAGWGMAQAVLAGIWSYEDHGTGWEKWVRVGEALDGVRRSA
jgi:streptomycin 6-kinase